MKLLPDADMITYVQSLRSDQTAVYVDSILACIAKGWSLRQMRARFRQSCEAMTWQARHGDRRYRASNAASAELYRRVIAYLTQVIDG